MPNTFTQLHIQVVFAVSSRRNLIKEEWKNNLYNYMVGIIENNGHKSLIINGMPDHIHVLFGLNPAHSISELVQDIKGNSSRWINENKLVAGRFSWQSGFGSFSYSHSAVKDVIKYIDNQENHHRKQSFLNEYKEFLNKFGVEYNEKYLFKEILDRYDFMQ
ncbi:MAG: IS200/IS605 family transposase [Bacteroidetes bacterium]|nr:IS200/IS605 family transposase [Bacteroidota bacterium]